MKYHQLFNVIFLIYILNFAAPANIFAQVDAGDGSAGESKSLDVSRQTLNMTISDNEILSEDNAGAGIKFEMADEETVKIIDAKFIPVQDLLEIFESKTGKRIVTSDKVTKSISVYLKDLRTDEALKIILDMNTLAYTQEGGALRVMPAIEFMDKYGYAFEPAFKIETVRLSYTDGKYTVGILREMKSAKGSVFLNDREKLFILRDTPENIKVMKAFIKEVDVPLVTEVFNLKQALPSVALDKVHEMLTPDLGKMQVDERSNTLMITDKQSNVDEIESYLETAKEQIKAVAVDAKIIQIILNDEHSTGVDWEAIVTDFQSLEFQGFAYNDELNSTGNISVGHVSDEDYEILLDALDAVGVVYNISSVKLKMVDLEQVPFYVKFLDKAILGSQQDQENEKHQTYEVVLNIRPLIDKNEEIAMEINPKKIEDANEELMKTVKGDENNIFVRLENGDTLVIGSLFQDISIESNWKIPLLGDIPFLGFAFRNQGQETRKSEIIVFLTPRIVQKQKQ